MPNQEGLVHVVNVLENGAYRLETLDGDRFPGLGTQITLEIFRMIVNSLVYHLKVIKVDVLTFDTVFLLLV